MLLHMVEEPLFAALCENQDHVHHELCQWGNSEHRPDLGKSFACNPDCPKRILGLLGHHVGQQVLQKDHTLCDGVHYSVQARFVTPSLQCNHAGYMHM